MSDAEKYLSKYGKEEALNRINMAISEMIRSCPIKKHYKLVRKKLLKM